MPRPQLPLEPPEEFLWPLSAAPAAPKDSLFNSSDPANTATSSVTTLTSNLTKGVTVSKSLLMIDSGRDDKDTNSVTIALKDTGLLTASNYYSFGTTLFFKPEKESATKESSGGISFFASADGKTGYLIHIKTTGLAAFNKSDEFQILKTKYDAATNKTILSRIKDSQEVTKTSKLTEILQGTAYKIDVNVEVGTTITKITAFVNGFKITAEDKTNPLPKSSRLGLFCSLGGIGFDYVYARSISEEEYKSNLVQEIYKTQFDNMAKIFLYGDLWLSGINRVQTTDKNIWVEEFGPVAREIKYIDKDYSIQPAAAKYISTNVNKYVDILGSNLSPFNVKAYIINSSGTFVPLNQTTVSKISVVGNNIINSSGLIYMDESLNKYDTQEPIAFDSKWIQRESEAKELSDWIKTQWKNQQISLNLEVIANPKIQIGDIISVDYAYHELTGTEKFIVNSISQTWSGGIKTTIQARSIYSE